MTNGGRAKFVVLVILLFLIGLFLGYRISRWLGVSGPRRTYDTPVLVQQVQTLSELVTVKYVVEKVEVWEDPPTGLFSPFIAGDNRILILARGIVKAGVDFSKLKSEDIRVQDKTIWIRLPSARVTDAYLDDKETKVIERKTGFLRSFDKDLEQNIRKTAVEDMRASAARGGILRDADERARTQLAGFFKLMGFDRVEFEVKTAPIPSLRVEDATGINSSNLNQDRTLPQIHSSP